MFRHAINGFDKLTALFLSALFGDGLHVVDHVERYTSGDFVDDLLNDEERGVERVGYGVVASKTEPCCTGHDDSLAEDSTHAVVVDDAGEGNVVVGVLWPWPLSSFRDVLGHVVYHAHSLIVPV